MGDTSALVDDPEARLDFLLDHDVLVERDDGLAATETFHQVRGIYEDTYLEATDETFRETVADVFGLSAAAAAERIDEHGVTREELATYLALDSHLEEEGATVSQDVLALMAAMVTDAAPVTPVPRGMRELTDEDYASFLEANPDAVVVVFRRNCDPCDQLKDDLDRLRGDAPNGVAFAGVDGEAAGDLVAEFEVEAAPTTLLFADGELAESIRGRRPPAQYREAFDDVL